MDKKVHLFSCAEEIIQTSSFKQVSFQGIKNWNGKWYTNLWKQQFMYNNSKRKMCDRKCSSLELLCKLAICVQPASFADSVSSQIWTHLISNCVTR